MLRLLSFLSVFFLSLSCFAIEYQSYEVKDKRLYINTDEQTIQITPLSASSFEVLYLSDRNLPELSFPSFAL